ncbi:MAG: TerB family tellurite resistance protein [Hyphomonadaceae bacterium]
MSVVNIFQPQQAAPQASSVFDTEKLKQSFTAQRHTDWTIGEAFLALLLSAAGADGKVSAEEQNELFALAGRSRALKSMDQTQLAQANAVVSQRLAERANGLEEACQALPTDMRLTILAHCIDLVLSDGDFHKAEADFLNAITGHLGVDQADAERIMQVLLIKNRF